MHNPSWQRYTGSMRNYRSLLIFVSLALLHLSALAQEPPTITDELVVQERSVIVHIAGNEDPDTAAIRLQVGSSDQAVARLEKVDSKYEPWNIVLWVDRQLVAPSEIAPSTAALGSRSAELCELGFVTLVVADPLPRTIVSATRNVADLDKALAGLAGTYRQIKGAGDWRPPSEEILLQRLQALPDELELYSSDSPQAFFFLGGESDASSQDLESLASDDDDRATTWAKTIRALGRELALRRWITLGLVLRPTTPDRSPAPDPVEQLREETTGETRFFIDLLHVVSVTGSESKLVNEEAFETFILPRLAPVLTVVQQTGGSMIVQDQQIDLALEQLGASWRLWFRVGDAALEGVQSLDIRPVSGQILRIRAPRWIRLADSR